MKRFYLLSNIILLINLFFYSQDKTIKIDFNINYELPEELEQLNSSLPNTMVVYVKNGYSKKEEITKIGIQTLINNYKKEESYLLMEIANNKLAINIPNQNDSNMIKENISYKRENKKISGYNCKKAIINTFDPIKEEGHKIELFYTKKIKGLFDNKFKNLKGFPLEFNILTNEMTIKYFATNIEVKKIENKSFEIPKEFKILTMDQFQQLMSN